MKTLNAQQIIVIGSLAFEMVAIDESQRSGDIPALAPQLTAMPSDVALEDSLDDGECVEIEGRHWTVLLEGDGLTFYPEHPLNNTADVETCAEPAAEASQQAA